MHCACTHTHTHTRLTALFPGLPRSAGTRKVKPIWILLEQETVSGSGISWAICKPAPRSRQTTTPVPHHSSFLQAGCPSCRPTNSVKALKALLQLTELQLLHLGVAWNGTVVASLMGSSNKVILRYYGDGAPLRQAYHLGCNQAT